MAMRPIDFYSELIKKEVNFFSGVPDSLLKDFCLCIDENSNALNHIITANEGNAIALATGYHLATNKVPLVYMQNSGLGNAINPLISLCDPKVYSIPMLVMVGWRGEPGVKDEPQHKKQGSTQLKFLESIDCPYFIFSNNENEMQNKISQAIKHTVKEKRPVVLLMKKKSFEKYKKNKGDSPYPSFSRERALKIIINSIDNDSIIVSTTGKTSREIFEIRKQNQQSHDRDFLTVGSMGHCSSIALGIALAKPKRQVFCIDGDGAMLMHLGSLTTIANLKPNNFRHILLNNKVHESVGGQNTAAKNLNLSSIVSSLNSYKMFFADNAEQLISNFKNFNSTNGPAFFEIEIQPGSREDLGRPTIKPKQNKINFMKFLDK